jgi:hypothetical protein
MTGISARSMNEADLPQGRAVRERLAIGLLPRIEPSIFWGARGTGLSCDGCGQPIALGEVAIEIDVDRTYRFHVAICLKVWRVYRSDG